MKKECMGIVIAFMLIIGIPVSGRATFIVLDSFRGLQLTLQSFERTDQYAANLAKNNALKDQVEIWTETTSITPPSASTYDFVSQIDLTSLPSAEIAPPQESLEEALSFVKKTFFVPTDVLHVTEEQKAEVRNKRKIYVANLGKEIISYAAGVRSSTADDLKSLQEASSSAGGIIQEIELNTETVKSLALITAANVFLEARLMEMESASMLLKQEEQLLKKP